MGGAEGTGITLSGPASSYSKLRPGGGGKPQHVIGRVTLISVYMRSAKMPSLLLIKAYFEHRKVV